MFPGLAVADALRDRADVEIVFCGGTKGLEGELVPARGYRLERLVVEPMKGGGPARAARGALVAARATGAALALVRRLAPKVVLGVGGYAGGPVALAALLLRVPLVVLEPNRVAGLSNRLVAPFVTRAFVAWDDTARAFPRRRVEVVGVPLRRGFAPAPYAGGVAPERGVRVLVLGGSQGAGFLNDVVPGVLGAVARAGARLVVTHQAGKGRDEPVRGAYAAAGLDDVRVLPFLDAMAEALREADLVVARSGAGTVAEVTAVGRPAVFVPFPHAADDHQTANARAIEAAGGAVCVAERDGAAALEASLRALLEAPGRLAVMAEASARAGRPDAAARVADALVGLGALPLARTPKDVLEGPREIRI